MTLEQFTARVRSIAGDDHCVASTSICYYGGAAPRYSFQAYTETAGWHGVAEDIEDPEELLRDLEEAQAQGHRKTDPSGVFCG